MREASILLRRAYPLIALFAILVDEAALGPTCFAGPDCTSDHGWGAGPVLVLALAALGVWLYRWIAEDTELTHRQLIGWSVPCLAVLALLLAGPLLGPVCFTADCPDGKSDSANLVVNGAKLVLLAWGLWKAASWLVRERVRLTRT
jgi:hypothetical protein